MKFVAVMLGVGLGAVGCAAETSAPPDEKVGQTSEALTAAQQSQHDATTIMDAILAGNTSRIPASCTALIGDLNTLAADNAAGYVTITNSGLVWTVAGGLFGSWVLTYGIMDTSLLHMTINMQIVNDAMSCYPQDTYLGSYMFLGTSGGFGIDPSAAQLTQNLSSTKGSSAAATDTGTNAAVTAWQWPSSPSTGGSFAGGEPCSSVALSAGQNTSGSIQKSGSSLQYSKCL